jgi:hypothetical protein
MHLENLQTPLLKSEREPIAPIVTFTDHLCTR